MEKDITIVMIAHRLSTLKNCDLIMLFWDVTKNINYILTAYIKFRTDTTLWLQT